MPFTPFHFGPGLLVKSLVPRWWSWTAYCAAQVVIDVEPLVNIVRRSPPLHRFMHTFPGAALGGAVAALLVLGVREVLRRTSPELFEGDAGATFESGELWPRAIVLGAAVGGLSHPILDGLMHPDVRPFAPFTDANPVLGLVTLDALHLACLLSGCVGGAILLVRTARRAPSE